MALGDGIGWDQTLPTDATLAVYIDDHILDVRKGIAGRLALEHEFPASQAATAEAGMHKFITLQNQSTKPTLAGTQVGAVYQKTSALYYQNSAGSEIQITTGTGLSVAAGSVVQIVNTETGAVATGTTDIPDDDTIPQITEGDEYMTLAVTPTSATNKLKTDVVAFWDVSDNVTVITALYIGTTANAVAAGYYRGYSNNNKQINFSHFMDAGTTGAMTFRVRIGCVGSTITFNGYSGARKLGGVMASSVTITEIKV